MSASLPLEVDGLTVRYGSRTALSQVSLRSSPGELVALAGPNGSGKSTLLRACLGLLPPAQGRVALFGRAAGSLSFRERARSVAWVPQEEALRDNLRLLDYVLYGRYAHLPSFAAESAEDLRVARQALAEAGLGERADSGVLELSGGEHQRVLLARALAQETPLLLLDEPTAHLDIGHQLDLLERVQRQVRERRLSVLVAMHDLNLAARFADRILVLSHGRLVSEGSPEEVLSVGLLREVWGVETELRRDPRTQRPYLLPPHAVGPEPIAARSDRRMGPVHVIGGGGSAAELLRTLVADGFHLTAGALSLLDSDEEAANELGLTLTAEVPFAPIGPETRRRTLELLRAARAVVLAPVPIGPGNLANLELLESLDDPPRVYLLPRSPALDYTGGEANRILDRLRARGAHSVTDVGELRAALRRALAPGPEAYRPSAPVAGRAAPPPG